jgi:hypothetical protein
MEVSDAVSGLGGAETLLSTLASGSSAAPIASTDKYAEYHSQVQRQFPAFAGDTTAATTPLFVRAVALVLLDALLIRTQAWTADSK